MKKLLAVATVVMCAGMALTALADEEKIHIGLAAKGFADPFTSMEAHMYEQVAAEKFGDTVELTVLDCEFDTNKQVDVLENFISMGVDAIICQTDDPQAVLPQVEKCKEAGIYFINDLVLDNDWAYMVESNPIDDGHILGERAVKYFQENNIEDPVILFMQGEVGNQHANAREKYCKEVLEENGYEVTATDTANWVRDEAIQLMENWCQIYDDIDAVICANDDMSLGVIQVLEQEGRLEGTFVESVDALAQAVQAVIDGKLALTVGKDIVSGCEMSLQLAVDLVNGVDRSADKKMKAPKNVISLDDPETVKFWADIHGIDYEP